MTLGATLLSSCPSSAKLESIVSSAMAGKRKDA